MRDRSSEEVVQAARVTVEDALRRGPLRLDLGCGAGKRQGYVGIDAIHLPGVDIVADLRRGLPFVADGTVDAIHTSHFLEHLEDLEGMLGEIHRVLRPAGRLEIVVPHFSNPLGCSDYTHRRVFGLYTMNYFAEPAHQIDREVPVYSRSIRFRILSVRLLFRPEAGRAGVVDRAVQAMVNRSPAIRRAYEARWSWLYPCREIRWVLEKA